MTIEPGEPTNDEYCDLFKDVTFTAIKGAFILAMLAAVVLFGLGFALGRFTA